MNAVDLKNIPFSRYGSYFVVSDINDKLYIRDVRRGDNHSDKVFEIGISKDYVLSGDDVEIELKEDDKQLNMIMPTEDTIRLKTSSKSIHLIMSYNRYDNYFYHPKGYYEISSYAHELRFAFHVHQGSVSFKQEHAIEVTIAPHSDVVIESFKVASKYIIDTTYQEDKTFVSRDFEEWKKSVVNKPCERSHLAAYITWSNMVKPVGLFKRYAMYMSMNWMTNIWSWDNCFGAIMLAKSKPELAYDQFLFFKDFQDETGMLPDYANTEYVSYACAKPPIYGWAYRYMMKRNTYFSDENRLREVYDFVKKQTQFWLNHRSIHGTPYYTHGNESGWDNGTNFEEGVPVTTPDLIALLIDQVKFLSTLCTKLNIEDRWQDVKESLMKSLIHLWQENEFRPYLLNEKKFVFTGDSLQNFIPLILKEDLPIEIYKSLLESFIQEKRFISPYGLATEAMTSSYYTYNGYWKGPIWAPVMLMFIDFLDSPLKEQLKEGFISCMNEGGMAENFDPVTGEGLVDPSFAWTSSTYLILTED